MKKLISVTLAICVALTSLFTGIYAMADSKVTSSDVKTKINESAIYLMSVKKTGFTVDNAGSLNSFIRAGVNMSDYKAEFAKSVKENLDSNGGKIQSTVGYDANNNWAPIKGESAGVYANVILALDSLGYSAKSFEGYNIVSAFENVKLVKDNENQYLFSSIFTVANKYGLKDYLKKAQNFLVNNYYEFGTGSTYYTSTDSTSQFVIAIAPYAGYQSFVDDALASIENFKKDGGYLYNFDNTYGEPKVNADSTALALAAYSAANNLDKAQKIYTELSAFECKDTKGAYYYEAIDKSENPTATADALTGLMYFYDALKAKEAYDATTTTTTTTAPSTTKPTTKKATTYAKDGSYVNKKQKKVSIKKLKKARKGFKASWKKVTGVSGYQIQISTSKKFSRETSTYSIKGNKKTSKSFKGLKAKKTYYVRVRTYKNAKVNGKSVKVYSSWSKVKSVKTK